MNIHLPPAVLLAPMEGVVDAPMRALLTSIGGIDQCVTEFIRVTDRLLPEHVFRRYCPEMDAAFKTSSGIPVFLQLLGGKAEPLAENAAFIASFNPPGIDLNFGCPAPTVNRHDGGATLLKYPDRLFAIVTAIRKVVPQHIPVTAKMRLGYADYDLAITNAQALQAAGASWITVHARTKMQAYQPPAHWEWIQKIRENVNIPVVANGDIWTLDNYRQCREQTGCQSFMLGRGLLAKPELAWELKTNTEILGGDRLALQSVLQFIATIERNKPAAYCVARTKQWLRLLARSSETLMQLFNTVKVLNQLDSIVETIRKFHDADEDQIVHNFHLPLLHSSQEFTERPANSF